MPKSKLFFSSSLKWKPFSCNTLGRCIHQYFASLWFIAYTKGAQSLHKPITRYMYMCALLWSYTPGEWLCVQNLLVTGHVRQVGAHH